MHTNMGGNLTQKELLYFEDAIGHEKSIKSILSESIKTITDENIKSFLESEIKVHENLENDLMSLLETKNE